MGIVSNFRSRIGQIGCLQSLILRVPAFAAIQCFKNTCAADAHIEVIAIIRIQRDGVNEWIIFASTKPLIVISPTRMIPKTLD